MEEDRFYREFGQMLKAARKKAGLTQAGLAKTTGMSRSSIANVETGRQRIHLHALFGLAYSLRVRAAELLPAQNRSEPDLAWVTQEKIDSEEALDLNGQSVTTTDAWHLYQAWVPDDPQEDQRE